MVAKKRKSKRQTLQQKYKIIKRTKQHHKKINKGLVPGNRKQKSKENRIPNEWPFKEELLKEVQDAKNKRDALKLEQKQKRSEEVSKRRLLAVQNAMNANSNIITTEPDEKVPLEDEDDKYNLVPKNLGQNSRRAFLSELKKVIESADVILQVLDARDPIGTRSTAIEDMVLSGSNKKLVLILNKADLVPKDILAEWLVYLRKLHPTIPFKCNTQNQKLNLSSSTGKANKQQESLLHTNHAVGAEELIGLLKNYCRSGDLKTIIAVGVVGFPNVGKSSLINSLMRTRAVAVSSTPGFTRTMQEIILDKNIRLLDSPGIVFADGNTAATALKNCVNVEEMEDVLTPVQEILSRCPQQYLMQLYSISSYQPTDCTTFLSLVAKSTGKLKKGGIPNINAAARTVLHDWNEGKIKHYCKPPVVPIDKSLESDSKVLSTFSTELNIFSENPLDDNDNDSNSMMETDFIGIDEVAPAVVTVEDMSIVMNEDHNSISQKTSRKNKKGKVTTSSAPVISSTDDEIDAMTTSNDNSFGMDSNMLKLKKSSKKILAKKMLTNDTNTSEQYNFENDFTYSK